MGKSYKPPCDTNSIWLIDNSLQPPVSATKFATKFAFLSHTINVDVNFYDQFLAFVNQMRQL